MSGSSGCQRTSESSWTEVVVGGRVAGEKGGSAGVSVEREGSAGVSVEGASVVWVPSERVEVMGLSAVW